MSLFLALFGRKAAFFSPLTATGFGNSRLISLNKDWRKSEQCKRDRSYGTRKPGSICQHGRHQSTFLVGTFARHAMAALVRITSRNLEVAHDERREFFAQVRRNAGLEASRLAAVIPFHHLAHFMQTRDDPGLTVRHGKLDEFAGGP